MNFEQIYDSILEEGISPVVYHTTTYISAVKIMSTNRFILSPAHDTMGEYILSKKLFYISTSRMKLNPFSTGGFFSGIVTFTLDGRKLSNNLQGRGVDFFGDEGYRRDSTNSTYESEDRITSNNPTINNFLNYVTEVSIHVRGSDIYSDGEVTDRVRDDVRFILKISELCKKHSIKFGLYNSPQNFSLSKNPINVDSLLYTQGIVPETFGDDVYYSKFKEDIDMFHSLIHLIMIMDGKTYRGRSELESVNKIKGIIRSNPRQFYIHMIDLIRNAHFVQLPAVRQHVSYLMKQIKLSGLTSDLYLQKKVKELTEKINEFR